MTILHNNGNEEHRNTEPILLAYDPPARFFHELLDIRKNIRDCKYITRPTENYLSMCRTLTKYYIHYDRLRSANFLIQHVSAIRNIIVNQRVRFLPDNMPADNMCLFLNNF